MNINLKKHNKHLLVLTLASILLTSAFVGIAFAFRSGTSVTSDWAVFEGTAGNDYYDGRQYSYKINQWAYDSQLTNGEASYAAPNPSQWWFNANKSLRLGMTEYGEFANRDLIGGVAGIAYGYNAAEWRQTETWAAQAVNPALYIQGWVFYMNYTRAALPRAIEAYAIFSDTAVVEGARKVYSWVGDRAPNAVGAVLTAGSLVTSGVEVLYDSARLTVGRTSIIIRDGAYSSEDVAKVTITVVFSKVTKYAIVYKDVKILLDSKVLDLIKDFSFGERYELDLARGDNTVNPSNQAYIHYFEDYKTTVYQHPLTGESRYDVVQAFNPARNYTYFAGYWPNATEFSVYDPLVPDLPNGFTRVLAPGREIADIPTPPDGPGEASTPWVFAQWRYNYTMWPSLLNFLAKDANREIRFVEVAGMTDYNKLQPAAFRALDSNAGDGGNYVDVEIQYLLNSVFNPEDLANTVSSGPIQWVGVGQNSLAVDSAGAAMLADMPWTQNPEPLALLDKDNTFGAPGTIPFGLDNEGNLAGYIEAFSNSVKGTGTDATTYMRTALDGFAFDFYDGTSGRTPPQPIAGGISKLPGYWYPSKDPLTERWSTSAGTSFSLLAYDSVNNHPNGILTVGGPKANWLSRYFNDFNFAIDREGTSASAVANGGAVTGTAPTSDPNIATFDFFPLSSWKTSVNTFGYSAGYGVISVARDINGTRGISVYGWDGRDTYWTSAWADKYLTSNSSAWLPTGCVSLVLNIQYSAANREPTAFTLVKALGTITEFGYNRFADAYGMDYTAWTDYIVSNTVPPVTIPFGSSIHWYWEKLPTTSTARIEFDP
jgi:hypothetical protein